MGKNLQYASGHDAENHLSVLLHRENIPHKRATKKEDEEYKIDVWIWHERRNVWVKVQLTVANDPFVFGPKLEECRRMHVVYLALDKHKLIMAASRHQSTDKKKLREQLVAQIFRVIDEWIETDELVCSPLPSL